MIKENKKSIIITLSEEDIDTLDKINVSLCKKTYTQAIHYLITCYYVLAAINLALKNKNKNKDDYEDED